MDVVSRKVLYSINNEDREALGNKTLWRTNVVASHRKNKSLKISLRYVQGCEKRNQKQLQKPRPNFRSRNSDIVILDRSSFTLSLDNRHLSSYLLRLNEYLFFTCFLDQSSCL